jgi:hypothetical protein
MSLTNTLRGFAPVLGALVVSSGTMIACASNADSKPGGATADASVDASGQPGTAVDPKSLAAQDVTVLYPYPAKADLAHVLTAASSGTQGPLLPDAVYAKLPQVRNNPPAANDRAGSYLVGVRANCAFDTKAKDGACHGQLQLVFQLGFPEGGGGGPPDGFHFEDASIHAIYPLGDAEFQALLTDLLALRNANGGYVEQPLAAHPIMAQQGLGGSFASGLNALVLKYAGEKTLHKMTFITIEALSTGGGPGGGNPGGRESWKFGAFEEKGGVFEALPIPGLDAETVQKGIGGTLGGLSDATAFEFEVAPVLPKDGDISGLFGTGSTGDSAKAKASYDLALAIENPEKRSPADTDCVSCHMSHARARGESVFGFKASGNENFYADGASFSGATPKGSNAIRALGWAAFAERPANAPKSEVMSRAVSQRVLNETAYTLKLTTKIGK